MRLLHSIKLAVLAVLLQSAAWAQDGPAPSSGAAVYEASCAKCHSGGFGGFFTGAPKTGDREDWAPLAVKGIDALTATTLAGIGKMKPRGECTTCTDAEIRAAVEFMLQQNQ